MSKGLCTLEACFFSPPLSEALSEAARLCTATLDKVPDKASDKGLIPKSALNAYEGNALGNQGKKLLALKGRAFQRCFGERSLRSEVRPERVADQLIE